MEDSVDSYTAEARNCSDQEETSTWTATEVKPVEWTDEKHSLYLKSMEATFVNHLYKLLAQQSHKNSPQGSKLSQHKPTGICGPSGQYKVFRYGSWSKIDFMREEPEVNQAEEPGILLANPWVRHYRCSDGKANRKFSSSCMKAAFATAADQNSGHNVQLSCQGSEDGDTEVTDQNFNEEDLEEEKTVRIQEIKGKRTSTKVVSSTDQVVPSDNVTGLDNDASDHGQNED